MSEYPDTYEDVEVGDTFELDGTYEVTEKEIIEYAEQYDPQPFHVDPEAAAESEFDGLIASGFHVCAMVSRLLVDGFLLETGTRSSVGLDDLRWRRPVRPGDVLEVEVEIVGKRDWVGESGIVECAVDTYVGEDLVMSYVGRVLWAKESPE